MVASWVSQASFEPLGLTIAVAKDRAIESMMQVGRGPGGARQVSTIKISCSPGQAFKVPSQSV